MKMTDDEYKMSAFTLHVIDIINDIKLPFGWKMNFDINANGMYLYVYCKEGTCNVTGNVLEWKSRKWRLSSYMTDGEVVQTALLACLTASEHEIREQFKYKDVAIFDPHYDLNKLVELRKQSDSIKERN